MQFYDKLEFNATEKTALSVRDGILEYLGSEIGMDPADKTFTVYRSPATIANTALHMVGIPLTDEHVQVGVAVAAPVGDVTTAEMIDLFDAHNNSYLAIKNTIQVADEMLLALQDGKRELSLGYSAELVPHEKYDLEQRNIEPHHLAVVERGRCGSACSFLDSQIKELRMNMFLDAEGAPNLEEIAKVAGMLPEALKKLPIDKLAEVMPQLQEIVAVGKVEEAPLEVAEEPVVEDAGPVVEEEEVLDEEKEDEEKEKVAVTDSVEFKDAVKVAVARAAEVIDKAKGFLDAAYEYKGKDVAQVMRDALAVEHGSEQFSDAELDVAFKLLKKTESKNTQFGDSADRWEQLKEKEL